MLTIHNVHQCHICNSKNLVSLSDIYLTNGQFIENANMCKKCQTIHYIDDNVVQYDFKFTYKDNYVRESSDFEECYWVL